MRVMAGFHVETGDKRNIEQQLSIVVDWEKGARDELSSMANWVRSHRSRHQWLWKQNPIGPLQVRACFATN